MRQHKRRGIENESEVLRDSYAQWEEDVAAQGAREPNVRHGQAGQHLMAVRQPAENRVGRVARNIEANERARLRADLCLCNDS